MDIPQLDQQVTRVLANFDRQTAVLRFKPVCDITDRARIDKLAYPGLYRIDIENDGQHKDFSEWIEWFMPLWHDPQLKDKFVPNLKKVRLAQHVSLRAWVPLYIGKARNIATRVNAHIDQPIDKRTFALKLGVRKNLAGQRFRVSVIRFEVDNYDVFLPRLESNMRAKYHPIAGKQ